jgi:hypothetical protein
MAGLTVDALEPDAPEVMRTKAVLLLADEFLARAASPQLATVRILFHSPNPCLFNHCFVVYYTKIE